ncbi:MAG: hypothetical protein HETSPECPRED_006053 [Heterodermia speciosa]|uniref:Meiotically up-regulated gene 190 protein n=1 Tax=Heterodermia speciosa TaxID=116794 RepID=A0A8H3HX59_9LECA|nr:MAG: hypothetical protein HETSPECPRED_006053 [Heterodermia speciosa]
MSASIDFDENASRRNYTAPYTSHHPVPNIQDYRESKHEQNANTELSRPGENVQDSQAKGLVGALKSRFHLDEPQSGSASSQDQVYDSRNRNAEQPPPSGESTDEGNEGPSDVGNSEESSNAKKGEQDEDTVQSAANELDPRQKRKNMKHMKRDDAEREVTDPVTHLPVMIHDSTSKDVRKAPENEPPPGSGPRTSTGFSGFSKSETELEKETEEIQADHEGMVKLFPPPNFDAAQEKLTAIYKLAIGVGLGSVLLVTIVLSVGAHVLIMLRNRTFEEQWLSIVLSSSAIVVGGLLIGGGLIWGLQGWMSIRIRDTWDEEVWNAAASAEKETAKTSTPESTQWLNSLLASIWSLINPDLFTSIADTLEDVMQASLPKLVRMISVEDLGQGSESIRILGVRWLPTGAAAKDVSIDGGVKTNQKGGDSDRKVPGKGQVDDNTEPELQRSSEESQQDEEEGKKNKDDQENIAEGMEAEEGDFVNMEVAFSYRAFSGGKSLKTRAKNAHLYLAFYLPGGIRLPVWVELRGIIGTMRMRLQLCPDPPFFSLCTLTLLGQPKANLSCVPLMKKGLNLMDLPLISSFVQSSIDAALAEYVAPKSLTLDLKDMLVGDDFKKDTSTRGVLVVKIKSGTGFKEGDPGIGGLKKGSSDAYVTVGWAKFGKPVWSTRVIVDDMEPVWDETSFMLVGQEELNADERLRVQLWDSDRVSADDDLGKIEISLKELMHHPNSKARMWDRHDSFLAFDSGKDMPGSLYWSVGYFPKSRIQEEQFQQQTVDSSVRNMKQLKEKVSEEVDRKLREATDHAESLEIDQQKAQDLKIKEDNMLISVPPSGNHPTGIFSIQIHQITGLELQQINKNEGSEGDDTEGNAGDLPSSYCTIILNHQKIFKTRTKPKNAKPFFNAGTERLIRDWRTTEVILSVRDSRVHENDPLLGIIYLPLAKIFKHRSQIVDQFPLVGGIGYGRARISLLFRSIELQAPRELLGWDYGTLDITGPITSKDIASELSGLRIKLRTSVSRAKMYFTDSEQGKQWTGKRDRSVRLAVRKRYCSCLVVEFRKNRLGPDKTPAFAVLWLKDIPDEEQLTINIPVWEGHDKLKRGESCCVNDLGEKLGSLDVPLKFLRGLSGYHKGLASNSPDLQDVFEVLATADDNQEVKIAMDGDDSSSDSSSSDEEDNGEKEEHDDGKRGALDQIKDYSKHSGELKRTQRGVMQFKGVRTADWMKTKLQHGKDHLAGRFQHHEREPGVETEV